nr:MAG: DNA pilot protein [Microvirus sp.]
MDPATIAALFTTAASVGSDIWNRKQEQKQYKKLEQYNTPKAQMQRYSDAGLSPYLIYGQGSSGNMSAPAPASTISEGTVEKGIGAYTSMANFNPDLRAKRLDNALRESSLKTQEIQRKNMEFTGTNTALRTLKTSLETLADFPGYNSDDGSAVTEKHVSTSYRRKLNELKMAASQAATERVMQSIQGMKYDNVVKRVKGKYASDYGMVGGDWTQGLGLVKSLPNFFKSKGNLTQYQKQILKRYPK